MVISIILDMISIQDKDNLPWTREKTKTQPIEELGDEEDNMRSTMHVEYVYVDNTQFLLSIAASNTDHQIKFAISLMKL